MAKDNTSSNNNRYNQDPITGKAGSHPIGAGVGTTVGAATGAALGAGAGPVGLVGGAVIGGIAGWLDGRVVAESVNPTAEERYWHENFSDSPYFDRKYNWEDYQSAYTMGYSSYDPTQSFSEMEPQLEERWEDVRGESRLTWDEARDASKDAWSRVSKADSNRH